jgi:hypothetical protein
MMPVARQKIRLYLLYPLFPLTVKVCTHRLTPIHDSVFVDLFS